MRTLTRVAGLLVAVATMALAVVVTALPASAHAELVSTSPAGGATVQELPQAATLTFSEPIRTPAFVEITGPSGADVATGDARIVDEVLTQRLGGTADAGEYALSYRVTSADGHAISGTVRFTLAGAAGATGEPETAPGAGAAPTAPAEETAPTAADESSGGMGTGQLLLLLGVLAVGLVALAVGTRRALRHSVAMVDDRKGGRSARR